VIVTVDGVSTMLVTRVHAMGPVTVPTMSVRSSLTR
jgi:hypothetical protein